MENEDLSSPVAASDAAVAAPTAPNVVSASPPPPAFDPRRRIRELLAIPERDRTDAEWDELNELEIQTAPGNRIGNQPPASYSGKPAFHAKHRMKGKAKGKPGQSGNRPPGGGKAQNHPNKPRPA
ncbi:hypothetical protein [Sulfuricystis multivorans]|uniref:hypothetical protein n=1 Tax=Sulfuricystis multivorans TaxID=2211108 RepID=UPI000F817A25|nr:hypothetical protein [Sulfuricystis multivorans]